MRVSCTILNERKKWRILFSTLTLPLQSLGRCHETKFFQFGDTLWFVQWWKLCFWQLPFWMVIKLSGRWPNSSYTIARRANPQIQPKFYISEDPAHLKFLWGNVIVTRKGYSRNDLSKLFRLCNNPDPPLADIVFFGLSLSSFPSRL